MSISFESFAPEVKRAIVLSQRAAHSASADEIGCSHLLYGALAVGGAAARRLGELGLTATSVSTSLGVDLESDPPAPMGRRDVRELRAQLRGRGLSHPRIEAVVERLQRQRSTGPVTFDAEARALIEACASDGVTSVVGLLQRLLAESSVAAFIGEMGTTTEAALRTLAPPGADWGR